MAKDGSIGDFVGATYFSVSGRFASYFNIAVISKTIILLNEHRFFPILFWFVGVSMCFYVAKSVFKTSAFIVLLNSVLFFYNLYVLTNIDFAVFNWLCAMDYYLSAPVLLLLLYLVNNQTLNWKHWIILVFLVVAIGGSQESFTPIALAALFFNGLYYFNVHHFKFVVFFNDKRSRQIIVAGILMLICFVIVLVAPGNYHRMEMTEFVRPTNLSAYLFGFTKSISTLYYFMLFNVPYYIILAILSMYLGIRSRQSTIHLNINHKSFVLISILVYSVYILFSVFPGVFLWSGFGIQRIYTHVVFFTMLFISIHAFLYGYFKETFTNKKYVTVSLKIGVAIMCVIMSFNLYNDTISARNYAQSVDNRIASLQQLNKNGVKGVVIVKPLSVPYTIDIKYNLLKIIGKKQNQKPLLYYISDTDISPNEYNNHLRRVYGFNFDIILSGNAFNANNK